MKFYLQYLILLSCFLGAANPCAAYPDQGSDDVVYFIMIDRFANGNKDNDHGGLNPKAGWAQHGFKPDHKGYYHGGDFVGIINRLDYLKGLGVNTLWLSPIFRNKWVQGDGTLNGSSAGYHGYWITDFTAIDPHFGSETEFRGLLKEAHKRGLKVIIDIVVNHTADVISYDGCGDCPYRHSQDYPWIQKNPGFTLDSSAQNDFSKYKNYNHSFQLNRFDVVKKPEWLNDPLYYHNRGNSTFSGESTQWGDFYGLDDLFTEHPKVVAGMIDIYRYWIENYDIDGFRLDTVKHVNPEFWASFIPAMQKVAADAGKKDFRIFGEVFSGDVKLLRHTISKAKIPSFLDFGFYGAVKDVFALGQSQQKLRGLYAKDDFFNLSDFNRNEILTFISNHDVGRIGHSIQNNRKKSDHRQLSILAHGWMILGRGIPVLYYGDEQGFTGDGGDQDAREDMFISHVSSYKDNIHLGGQAGVRKDHFNVDHPLYRGFRDLIALRQQEKVLRSGSFRMLTNAEVGSEALLGFVRTPLSLYGENNHQSDSTAFLVLFNRNNRSQSFSWEGFADPNVAMILPEGVIKPKITVRSKSMELTVPPLSMVVIKGRITSPELSPTIVSQLVKSLNPALVSPEDLGEVTGTFPVEVRLPNIEKWVDQGLHIVVSARNSSKEAWKYQGEDWVQPFRVYVDADDWEPASTQYLKVELLQYGQRIWERTIEVDKAMPEDKSVPKVKLIFPHGSLGMETTVITHSGEILPPQLLGREKDLSFNWQLTWQDLFIVLKQPKQIGSAKYWQSHQPVFLTLSAIRSMAKDVDGQSVAVVYVSSDGRISDRPTEVKPGLWLPFAPDEKAPIKQNLFIRGD